MEFERKELPEQHYIYVDRECPFGPEMGAAMASAFGEVFGFLGQHGLTALSMPMTVYPEMPGEVMRFQGGVLVSKDTAAKAEGPIKAGTLAAGPAMSALHVGGYDRLGATHKALWAHMKDQNIDTAMPVWEIYLDDPETTEPDELRTQIYRKIA